MKQAFRPATDGAVAADERLDHLDNFDQSTLELRIGAVAHVQSPD
jgi:hypothetical protein